MNLTSTHERVSKSYANAIIKLKGEDTGSEAACCGPECCAGSDDRFVAEALGYEAEGRAHPEAAGQTMGCGNPLAFAGVEEGQTVLDLGSGAGFDMLIARDKVGNTGHVIGVDMTDAMIETARKNIRNAGYNNVEVRKGLIEKMPVESGTVDWVISNCVINLSPDKPAVFREINRVLKVGGKFSISDIVAEELPDWLRSSAEAYDACIAGTIPEAEYLAGLRAAGLEADDVTDRIVYDKSQMRALAGDPSVDSFINMAELTEEVIEAGLSALEGKIWSSRFTGTKTRDLTAEELAAAKVASEASAPAKSAKAATGCC